MRAACPNPFPMATVAAIREVQRIEQLVLDFLAYLEFERGLSRNTLEAYRSDLLQYGRFLAERQRVGHRGEQRRRRRTSSRRWPRGPATAEPASPATIHRKSACLRSFYRHLRRDGLRESDPTGTLSAPRRSRKLPHVLTRGEVEKLLAQPRGSEPAALRDRALLELMYACGLRASEAIGLEVVRRGPRGSRAARARQGLEGARGADRAGGGARGGRLPRARPGSAGEGAPRAAPVRELPRRVAHAPGALQDRPQARPDGRAGGSHEPAHAAPQLRHPPAGRRLRPALGAGDARPRRRVHHPALHAPLERAPQGRVLPGAPARDRSPERRRR